MEKDIERGLEKANSQESEEVKEGLIQLTNILQDSGTIAYDQLSPILQYCLGRLLKKIEEMGAPEVELTNFVNAIKKYLSEHVELPKPDGLVIDWSDNGRVSKVRDQKSANICWIIEAVAAVESAYMIQQKTQGIHLNIQEVVDEFGMDSGEVETVFEYIQNNGLSPESEYRWTGRVRTKRRHVKDKSSWCIKIATYYTNANVPYDERLEVLNKQPFVGGMLFTPALRYLKKGEIYVAPTLDPDMLDELLKEQMHFVLVVGWGKQKGTEKRYFKVKNSWGTTWADKGYGLVDEAAVLGLAYPIDPKKVNNS